MAAKEVVKYLGADIISSTKYAAFKDVLNALLDANKEYSTEEIDKVIFSYNKAK